jgi:hypothetical protein
MTGVFARMRRGEGDAMDMFWMGAAFGGGAVALLGLLSRAVLHANAERHYRAAYVATLTPETYQRLAHLESIGASTWRQFREKERERAAETAGSGE